MILNLEKRELLSLRLNMVIRFFLIIFAIGSPLSISFAQIGLVPAMVLWLFKIIFLNKNNFYGTFLDLSIFIYLLGTLITSTFCEYSVHAFKSIQEVWHIILLYLLIDIGDIKFTKKLINILFLFTLLIGIAGIIQFFAGWAIHTSHGHFQVRTLNPTMPGAKVYDVIGGFGLHLTYGCYVTMMFFLGLTLMISQYRKNIKLFLFYCFGTLVIFFNVVASGARSAWVGFLAGLLLWGFLKNKKMAIIILIFFFFGGAVLYFTVPAVKYKADSFKYIKESYRWQIWSVAVSMIKDHSLIGVGHGNFKKYYDNYRSVKNWRESIGHPHNDYFSVYLTAGLTGFIGYILLWVLLIKKSIGEIRNRSEDRNYILGLMSGVIAFMFAGLSQNYFTSSINSMLAWFFISALAVFYYKDNPKILIKDKIRAFFMNKRKPE